MATVGANLVDAATQAIMPDWGEFNGIYPDKVRFSDGSDGELMRGPYTKEGKAVTELWYHVKQEHKRPSQDLEDGKRLNLERAYFVGQRAGVPTIVLALWAQINPLRIWNISIFDGEKWNYSEWTNAEHHAFLRALEARYVTNLGR